MAGVLSSSFVRFVLSYSAQFITSATNSLRRSFCGGFDFLWIRLSHKKWRTQRVTLPRLPIDSRIGYYYFMCAKIGGSRGDCTLTGFTRTTLAKLHDKANIRLTSVENGGCSKTRTYAGRGRRIYSPLRLLLPDTSKADYSQSVATPLSRCHELASTGLPP